MAVGEAATFAQPVARKYSRLPANSRCAHEGLPLRRKRTRASRSSSTRAQPVPTEPTRSRSPFTAGSRPARSTASTSPRMEGGRLSKSPLSPEADSSGMSPSTSSDR